MAWAAMFNKVLDEEAAAESESRAAEYVLEKSNATPLLSAVRPRDASCCCQAVVPFNTPPPTRYLTPRLGFTHRSLMWPSVS